jgi:hypothetical protein
MCIVPGRGGAAAARRAHNPKVRGSNPLPATKDESTSEPRPARRGSCFLGRRPRGILTLFRASAPGRPSAPQDRGCRDGVGRRAGRGAPATLGQSLDRLEGRRSSGISRHTGRRGSRFTPGRTWSRCAGQIRARPRSAWASRDTLTGPAGGREDSGGGSGGRCRRRPGSWPAGGPRATDAARHGRHATRAARSAGGRFCHKHATRTSVTAGEAGPVTGEAGPVICTRRGRSSSRCCQVRPQAAT